MRTDDQRDESEERKLASIAAYEREMVRLGELLQRCDEVLASLADSGVVVTRITIGLAAGRTDGKCMAVLKATAEGKEWVAFHSSDNLKWTLVGVLNRMENRSHQWKEDTPYKKG